MTFGIHATLGILFSIFLILLLAKGAKALFDGDNKIMQQTASVEGEFPIVKEIGDKTKVLDITRHKGIYYIDVASNEGIYSLSSDGSFRRIHRIKNVILDQNADYAYIERVENEYGLHLGKRLLFQYKLVLPRPLYDELAKKDKRVLSTYQPELTN